MPKVAISPPDLDPIETPILTCSSAALSAASPSSFGFTDDGNWSVNVPAQNGPTTYQFIGRRWGPNGSKYAVFSSC